ncbi:MAG: peptidoglycan-associated lipoprotein Pal [Rhodospirillales bacterium]|nr:peptidoglycan-associated lipoprotein Pal [Rhodospirillales bacterium]
MSNAQFVSSRAALASAALLSLALLAGCQSKPDVAGSGDIAAGAGEQDRPAETKVISGSLTEFEGEMLKVGDRVHFELDRYDLTPEAQATLRQQAALLQNYPQIVVTIEGHADERGTREYNLALGERRADAVRNYLTILGVSPDRVTVTSYGKERPECPGADEQCWSQNRRGVTVASQ